MKQRFCANALTAFAYASLAFSIACSGPSTNVPKQQNLQNENNNNSSNGGTGGSFTNPFSNIALINLSLNNTTNNREYVLDQVELSNGDTLNLVKHTFNVLGNSFNTYERAAVVKLKANNDLDTSFGIGGVAHIDFNSNVAVERPRAIQVNQTTGEIYVVSTIFRFSGNTLERDIALAKLNASGGYETSFGSVGRQTYDIAQNFDGQSSKSDDSVIGFHRNGGRLFIVGVTDTPSNTPGHFLNIVYLIGINALNGVKDTTVGDSGLETIKGITAYTNNMKRFRGEGDFGVDASNRMYVAINMLRYNYTFGGAHQVDHALFRFKANGDVDTPTGPQTGYRWTGIKTLTGDCLTGPLCFAATRTKIKVLSDGKVIMAASSRERVPIPNSYEFTFGSQSKVTLHKVNENGFEENFGNYAGNQTHTVYNLGTLVGAKDVEVDPNDGRIYVSLDSYAMRTSSGVDHKEFDSYCSSGLLPNQIHILRASAGGLVDSTFGQTGTQSINSAIFSWTPYQTQITAPAGCSMSESLQVEIAPSSAAQWKLLGGAGLNIAGQSPRGMIYRPSLPN